MTVAKRVTIGFKLATIVSDNQSGAIPMAATANTSVTVLSFSFHLASSKCA